ncbi:hypothetical protein GCM10027067_21690 [Pseudactinotalea suaedae]
MFPPCRGRIGDDVADARPSGGRDASGYSLPQRHRRGRAGARDDSGDATGRWAIASAGSMPSATAPAITIRSGVTADGRHRADPPHHGSDPLERCYGARDSSSTRTPLIDRTTVASNEGSALHLPAAVDDDRDRSDGALPKE